MCLHGFHVTLKKPPSVDGKFVVEVHKDFIRRHVGLNASNVSFECIARVGDVGGPGLNPPCARVQ